MGFMRHHAIVVTSCIDEKIEQAHEFAVSLFPWVSPISPSGMNGFRSFFVPPDGSKEGWAESAEGDLRRARLRDFLRSLYHDDQSTSLHWAELIVSSDDDEAAVTAASDLDLAAYEAVVWARIEEQ
jgi:hypothetical protein